MKDSLGDRMKNNYENVTRSHLVRRMPVIIRLDGKSFHTYTKRMFVPHHDLSRDNSPWSDELHDVMIETCRELLLNTMNAKLVYSQSDEISILLTDWDKLETEAWFDNNIQKICSVSSSIATANFNGEVWNRRGKVTTPAYFDSRAFNIPKEEVCNYFIWRQQDASRNSVQMLGQFYISHKEMQGLNNNQVQDKLMLDYGINWNNEQTWKKRGFCVYRNNDEIVIDNEIPIFTQDRNFVEKYL